MPAYARHALPAGRSRRLTMLEPSFGRRATSLGAVVLAHVLVLLLLAETGGLPPAMIAVLPARLILQAQPPPPPPPPVQPALAVPPAMLVPVPDIRVAAPLEQPAAPRAITRVAPMVRAQGHFGAGTDSGLGLGLEGLAGGGGAGARGTLAGFEAAVRRQVLAGRRQPVLAWDRRNTCVVNYTVTVTRAGALAGFTIDPCAISEINEAARAAIRGAAPFPPPPEFGGGTAEVHGSLIFHP